MKTFIYHKDSHTLREKTAMELPMEKDYYRVDGAGIKYFLLLSYNTALREYRRHIDELKEYPCYPGNDWEDGKEYVEGRDFEFKDCDCTIGLDCSYNPNKLPIPCKVAYSIQQKTDAEMEQMWKDADGELKEVKPYPIGGYAPGNYHCTCCICGQKFIGDKRAVSCFECETKPKRVFTLQDMLECWEAGKSYGIADERSQSWSKVNAPDKKQYFKDKFNIDIT